MPLQIRYSGWINYQQGFYSIHRLEIGSEGIEWFRIQDCRLFYTADSCWIHIRQAEVDYPKSAEWIKQNFPSESNPAKPGSEFHFSRLICRRIQIDKLELTGLTPHPIRLDLKAEVDHEKNGVGWRIRRLNPVLTADRGGSWGCEGRVEAGHDSGWVYRIQASDSLDKFRVGFNGNFYTSPFRIDYQGHIMGHQIKDWLSLPDTIQFLGRLDLQDIQLDLEGTADTAQINVHHLKSRLTKIMGSPLELELENAGYDASTRNLNWRQLMLEWDGLRIYGNGRLNLDSLIMDGDYQMDWTRLPIRIPDLVTAGGGTLVFSHFVLTDPRADWIDFSFDIGGFYRDYPIKLGGSGRIQLNNPWISLVYGNGHINSLEWNARGWGRMNGTEFRLRTDLVGTSIRENPGGSVILADSLIAHIGVVRSRSAPPMVQIELNTPRISVDEIQIENMRAVTRNWNVMDLRSGEFELSMDQVKIQDATLVSSLSMKTMVMPNRHLDLHPIRIHLPGNSRLDLNGTLDPTHRPWSLTLENSRLELDRHFYPIAGSQPIRMDSLQRISVDSLMMMVGQSAIYLGGWYDLKTRDGSVTVNCTQLEIPELSPIIPLQEMTLVKTGRLSLTGVLELDSGTVHRADLHARARKLLWDEVSVDEIELKADWSNGRIRINDLQARDYNHHLEFHGVFDSIPSAWYLTGTLEGDGEIPFYLSRYIPDVYLLTGRYRISAGCTGPVRDLNWQGTLKIDSTELFLNVLETPIRNIRLDSHFSRDTLWVDSVSGWTVSSSQHKKNFWNLSSILQNRLIRL